MGAGLFKRKGKGEALRSVKKPESAYDDPVIGKDPQPGHMKDYVDTASDNGGVHINSRISNRAVYLTATELGENAWGRTNIRIFFRNRPNKFRSRLKYFMDAQ
jgi:Zn-dependent metalloprotease